MISFERGDIVLVRYAFADEPGAKQRPGLVVSGAEYNSSRAEAMILAITSNVTRLLYGDALIEDWRGAGLPMPSVLTATMRTIQRAMVAARLGAIAARELRAAERRVRASLDLRQPSPSRKRFPEPTSL
ncbi:MAG TPA: type II toxin-antitoxin system PemK/MazF family toxin [Terriglobales bacterium]|jgi:mRNA interferase MazF